jgi:hypothetical protein
MPITTPVIQVFDYRPPLWQTIGLLVVICIGAAMMGYFSLHPTGPVKSVRGIELSQEQFQWLCRIVFLASPISLLAVGYLLFVSLFRDRRVALTQHSVILPKPTWTGLSCDEIEIPYSEITDVDVIDWIGSARLLRIRHAGGKIHVPSNMFLSRQCFVELVQAVRSAAGCGDDPADRDGRS